jgi:hypothetical protein
MRRRIKLRLPTSLLREGQLANATSERRATVRVLNSWRTVSFLARKVAALGLCALVLLPVISTADDFHTCALHSLSTLSSTTQLSDPTVRGTPNHYPCLACSWQSVTDSASVPPPFWIELQPLYSLVVDPQTTGQERMPTPHHGRAPPFYFPC